MRDKLIAFGECPKCGDKLESLPIPDFKYCAKCSKIAIEIYKEKGVVHTILMDAHYYKRMEEEETND